jgi:integrating conjugative element protein (TIGR03756 family)
MPTHRKYSLLSLQRILRGIIFLYGILLTTKVISAPLSTPQIITRTLSATQNCLHYRVIGICTWQEYRHGVYSTNTTLKVEHYLPDVVVTVHQQAADSPWDYVRLLDKAAYPVGDAQLKHILGFSLGHGQGPVSQKMDSDCRLKEIEVIGSPTLPLLQRCEAVLIKSPVTAFKPYYVSLADSVVWRSPMIEMTLYPHYCLPMVRSIGSVLNQWGNVFPRTGFVLQTNDVKAAAVIAQRAADIISHSHQPHIYDVLPLICGQACCIDDVHENDPHTKWQMIYPYAETTCHVFGESDNDTVLPWKSLEAQKSNGDYVWILWRHYRGCIQGRGKYLGSINF